MADLMPGIGNLNNQMMNTYKIGSMGHNPMDFSNMNSLDDFTASLDGSSSSDVLKGAVEKIQQGEQLAETDFDGLSQGDAQFAKDLSGLMNKSMQNISSVDGAAGAGEVADNFSKILGNYLNDVNSKHRTAENAVETFASGGDIDLHTVMIASEKASLSMQLAMQLNSKAMAAYKEISRMQV